MTNANTKTLQAHYHHIDNGGVTVSIKDKGVKDGIVLSLNTSYHGHPDITSELRIEHLGADWLEKVGRMFIEAAHNIRNIDFDERYNNVK